ncbi:MAG: hypothetical protein HQL71_14785 [Magnetococcales bacterium]|nr:hypothetical protein [Magnetococcales bacterium]
MIKSFRGRLFLATILLLIVTELAIGLHLENGLRTWINLNVEDDLYRNAKAIRELLVLTDKPYNTNNMDLLADNFGIAIERRVTIIDPHGRVLGDSELSGVSLLELENHGDRPEVQQAIKSQYGIARRFSSTLNVSMLYVAVTYQHQDGLGVIRVQTSLSNVEQIINKIQ